MTERLEEAACTCRVSGKCETCLRWHAKLTEILRRKYGLLEEDREDGR